MSRGFSLYLDAMRLFAAVLVMLYHANWVYRPGLLLTNLGHEAVVVFFVLSGYVIAFVAGSREQDFRNFMIARGARIYSVAIPAIFITALLDFTGYHSNPAAYPEAYQAWDLPLVRAVTSLFFVNEVWTLAIQLFSNVPYWSLNYEVWYYVTFGVLHFVDGRRRWLIFAAICLFLGPKILLLMPIWWMGVWVYRSERLAKLSNGSAWACLLLSIAGAWCYVHFSIGQWGWDSVEAVVGEHWHRELSFSRQFISDYYLGAVLAVHFVGMRVLLANVQDIPARLDSIIRYLAGATFSIYLFHQPLLWFSSAFATGVDGEVQHYIVVLLATLLGCLALATVTERRKLFWKTTIESLLDRATRLVPQAARS